MTRTAAMGQGGNTADGRSRRRSVHAVAATLFLAAFACAGVLRGEDDTVVAAATARDQGQQNRQNWIDLDQQLNGMLFQPTGDADKTRKLFRERIMLEVAAADQVCQLTDRQRQKCEAAATLDVQRISDATEALREKYAGRTIDLQNQEGQAAWQRFHQEVQALQQRIQNGEADAERLVSRVFLGVLSDGQRSAWNRELEARAESQWRGLVDAGLTQLDITLGLTSRQHGAIRELLLEKPLRINQAGLRTHGGHFLPFVCRYALSRLDQKQLRSLVSERQWQTLAQAIEQGKGMSQHLKQQKVILE